MSFILDALKKSEVERQRKSQPGLIDTPLSKSKSRLPGWAIAIGALLAVNLLVLTWLLIHDALSAGPPPATQAQRTGPHAVGHPPVVGQAPAVGAASPPHFSPLDPPPAADYAPEIPVTNETLGSPSAASPSSTTTERTPTAAALAAALAAVAAAGPPAQGGALSTHRREPVLTDDDYKPADAEVLPTINEVTLSGPQALPELHLDVHVYATQPAERFVYINMHKYHEGATLAEGPVVERIRRDGVVLNDQGLRFLLPRQ
jgi:general secretion pathway protein B